MILFAASINVMFGSFRLLIPKSPAKAGHAWIKSQHIQQCYAILWDLFSWWIFGRFHISQNTIMYFHYSDDFHSLLPFFSYTFRGRTHKIFMRLSGCKINLLLQGRNKKCVSTECCWGCFYNLHVYQRQRHVCGALLICVHLCTHTYTCKFKANKKSPQKWRTEKKYIQNGW